MTQELNLKLSKGFANFKPGRAIGLGSVTEGGRKPRQTESDQLVLSFLLALIQFSWEDTQLGPAPSPCHLRLLHQLASKLQCWQRSL